MFKQQLTKFYSSARLPGKVEMEEMVSWGKVQCLVRYTCLYTRLWIRVEAIKTKHKYSM